MSHIKIINSILSIDDISKIDPFENNTYLFPISKFSYMDPKKLLSYLSSLGCHCDILVDNKSNLVKLIHDFMSFPIFFKSTILSEYILSCILFLKNIKYPNDTLTHQEKLQIINTNNNTFNKWITFFDSIIYYTIILASSKNIDNQTLIKSKYDDKSFSKDIIEINSCSVLLNPNFYEYYYKNGINDENKFYYELFEKQIYKNITFNKIVCNPNNIFYKTLLDLSNPKFQELLKQR